jgi:hypothetical protein
MDLIGYYVIFALATGFASMYELINPVLRELIIHEPDNVIVEYLVISKLTFFFATVLLAPVFFFSCVIPSFGNRFRDSFHTAIMD